MITALSIFGLIVTLADFLLPTISKTISSDDQWNSEKEKKFSIFVNRIAYFAVQVWNSQVQLDEWKRDKPNQVRALIYPVLMATVSARSEIVRVRRGIVLRIKISIVAWARLMASYLKLV